MLSFIYQLLVLALTFAEFANAYPDGAPSSACSSMTPSHGVSSQQCTKDYVVRADKTEYYNNDTVLITVSSSTYSKTFKGILLIAKTQNNQKIIGTWNPVDSSVYTIDCDGKPNTAITQSSSTRKTEIRAVWIPPSTATDQYTVIKATIVTKYSTMYVGCFSLTLKAKNFNSVTGGTTVPTKVSPTGFTSAGSSISSAATTPSYQGNGVNVSISWKYANGVTSAKMQIMNLKPAQWFAMGLSLDTSMGNDHVFVCKRSANDIVTAEYLVNPGGYSSPIPASALSNPGGTFQSTAWQIANGVVTCEFTLSGISNSKRRRRDVTPLSLTASYYPLLAIGNLDSSNSLMQHSARFVVSQLVQLNQNTILGATPDLIGTADKGLVKAHGIIMIFMWMFFAPTGIILAFNFKNSWSQKKLCGKAIWFSVHRLLMIFVAIFTMLAFILILAYEKGKWVSQSEKGEFAHSIVGIIIIVFAFAQPIMSMFRCNPDHKYRFIFNYAHGFVGFSTLFLSIVAMFIAVFFSHFSKEVDKEWGVLVAWSCWVFIIGFTFWVIEYCFDADEYKRHAMQVMQFNNRYGQLETQIESFNPPNTSKKDMIKGIFLAIHIVVSLSLSVSLSVLIGRA